MRVTPSGRAHRCHSRAQGAWSSLTHGCAVCFSTGAHRARLRHSSPLPPAHQHAYCSAARGDRLRKLCDQQKRARRAAEGSGFARLFYHMHARAGAGLTTTATAAAALSAHRYDTRRCQQAARAAQRAAQRRARAEPAGLVFRQSTEVVRAGAGARCAQRPVARAAGECELHRRERRPRGILVCAAPATLGGVCGCGMQRVACLLSLGMSHAQPRTQPPRAQPRLTAACTVLRAMAGQEGQLPRGIRREQGRGGWGQQHTSLTHTAQVRAARQAAPGRVQQPVHLCMASRRRQLLRVQPASVLRTVRVWV